MNFWQYLVLVNIYLLLFYGFYALLFRKETFFQLNRVYLITASLLSFLIPLVQSDWIKNLLITSQLQHAIYSGPVIFYRYQTVTYMPVTIGQVALTIYLAGVVILTARFARQMILLKKLITQSATSTPYSFFKKVKLTENAADNKTIGAHENVHVKQWHSADVLLIETVSIINWFNPVVYFYRSAIKHIHEFIADQQMISSGTDKSAYALLLLSQTFDTSAHQLVNSFFNHSLLKQRIMMMQKNKSQRIALIKYCLLAPLFILMMILSSATVNSNKQLKYLNKKAEEIFLTSAVGKTSNSPTKINYQALLADTVPGKDGKVFTSVEKVPEFPGGFTPFASFLGKNVRYPAHSREHGMQGKVVISFIVEEDGSLSNIRVARHVAADIDQEAIRVLNLSPKWQPGVQNGKPVRVSYSVPIQFSLDDKTPRKVTGAVVQHNPDLLVATNTKAKPISDTAEDKLINVKNTDVNFLYILDGKEVNNMQNINPNDIKRIDIIKDKSLLASYGPKGASGIVIITSKKLNTDNVPITKF